VQSLERRRYVPAVAAGSEKFQWNLFPGVRRQCRECGREPLLIRDVGEHRTLYPSNRTEFLCVECQGKKVNRLVKETRELGLQDRPKSA
jgi:hypothetical protein